VSLQTERASEGPAVAPGAPRPPRLGIWRAFRSAPTGIAALVALAILFAVAIVAPMLFEEQARELDVASASEGPSAEHVLGTDRLGRDILYRLLVATRLSIGLSVLSAGAGILLGLLIGALTAVLGHRPRVLLQRLIDLLQAFPTILVGIFVGAIMGAGPTGAVLGVGIAIAFHFARVASTLALSIGARDYVLAARVTGVRRLRLLLRHVVPNIAETLLITTTVAMSTSLVAISALSFLGVGVQPPDYDWGRMLNEGLESFYVEPTASLAPGICIALAAIAFGLVGEALARAMNPILWTATGGDRHLRPLAPPPLDTEAPPPAEADSDRILDVRNLSVAFPGDNGPVRVVSDVSLRIRKGEMVGIVGESGSGKTMTAMAIAQLLPHGAAQTGEIEVHGKGLRRLSERELDALLGMEVAVVFQDPMSSLNPALRIATQVAEARTAHDRDARSGVDETVEMKLAEVNIPSPRRVMQQHPHQLSGGMRQRVMIAMGLMTEPALLIADEPTTALDVTIQSQVMAVLERVNREHGTAVILISHNLGLVAQNCSRVLVMYAGRVIEDGPTERIIREPLHPYTRALLQAIPDLSRPRDEPLQDIPGGSPDLADPPSGCPYHPRCPLAVDQCRVAEPPLIAHAEDRRAACWVAGGLP
jgi:peptide/nickel transport system permease protein